MKYRLLEWIIAPAGLLIIAIYQIFTYWPKHRIEAVFFVFGGAVALWLLFYGIRQWALYKKRQHTKNNKPRT